MGAGTEEQRLQIIQQLQLQAQQGDTQAAAALSNLNSDMTTLTQSPPQVIMHTVIVVPPLLLRRNANSDS